MSLFEPFILKSHYRLKKIEKKLNSGALLPLTKSE